MAKDQPIYGQGGAMAPHITLRWPNWAGYVLLLMQRGWLPERLAFRLIFAFTTWNNCHCAQCEAWAREQMAARERKETER